MTNENELYTWRDGKTLTFDHNLIFGKGYDYDGLECLAEECVSDRGRIVIWPDRLSGGEWSYYYEDNGAYAQGFESREEIKSHIYHRAIKALRDEVKQQAETIEKIKRLSENGAFGTNKENEAAMGAEYCIEQANKFFMKIRDVCILEASKKGGA